MCVCEFVSSIPDQDDDDDDFVSRDSQLRIKQDKKGKGKKGSKKTGKKRKSKAKKGKKTQNKKGSSSPKKSRSKKREILTQAKTSAPKKPRVQKDEEDVGHDVPPTAEIPKRKRGKQHETAPKPAPKSKAKAKAKATASAAKASSHKEKSKTPKGTATKRGRKPRIPGSNLPSNPLRSNTLVTSLMDFAKQLPEELELEEKKLRRAIWGALSELQYTKLMPYWTRNGCGVKVWDHEAEGWKDIHTFTFNASSAPRRFKLAIALRCADLAAACLNFR